MGSHNWKSSQEIWFEFFLFMLISQQIAAFWRLSFWRIKADRSKKNYNYIIGYLALKTYQNICCRLQPLSIWSLNCFHHYSNNMKQLRSILRLTIFNIFSPSLKASKKFINIFLNYKNKAHKNLLHGFHVWWSNWSTIKDILRNRTRFNLQPNILKLKF